MSNDQAWVLTIRVKVTTMSGWQPEHSDVNGWLEDGGALELVAIDSVKEEKQTG